MTSYSHTAHHSTGLQHESKNFQLSPALKKKIIISVVLFHFFVIVLPYLVSIVASWIKPQRPKGMIVKIVEGLPGTSQVKTDPTPKQPIPEPPTLKPPTTPVSSPKQPTIKPVRIKPQPIIKPIRIKPPTKQPTKQQPKQPDLTPMTQNDFSRLNNDNDKIYQDNQTAPIGNNGGPTEKSDAYYDVLGAYIYPRWHEPSKTEMRDRTPVVTVAFTMDSEGRILKSSILQPSGIRPMDNSAMDLLKSLTSLPKPPPGITYVTVILECQSQ